MPMRASTWKKNLNSITEAEAFYYSFDDGKCMQLLHGDNKMAHEAENKEIVLHGLSSPGFEPAT